ncbi:MAG: polysaccharide deacetylase family protein [Burkholderiaceae bacterium]
MANPRIPYCFSDDGPPLKAMPEGAIMVHLVVNVEHWQFESSMPRTIITPPHGKETVPDVPNFSWADYGMRAGLPRILRAIEERGLPASTSINAGVITAYPQAAEAMRAMGMEFVGHGVHQKSLNHNQGESEEALIAKSLEMITHFTGQRPRGWLSPGLRETYDTPDLLKKQGLEYVFDWVVDDVPHWMQTKAGPLIALPYNLEINDSIVYAIERHSSDEMYERLVRTLALFKEEAKRRPRVLGIGLHPHLIGVPHRFGSFQKMLDLLMQSSNVCFVTGGQIADWFTAQVPPPAVSA